MPQERSLTDMARALNEQVLSRPNRLGAGGRGGAIARSAAQSITDRVLEVLSAGGSLEYEGVLAAAEFVLDTRRRYPSEMKAQAAEALKNLVEDEAVPHAVAIAAAERLDALRHHKKPRPSKKAKAGEAA